MKKSQKEKKQLNKSEKHRRLFIFITAFVFPVIVILLIELGLGVIGFGCNNRIVKKCTISEACRQMKILRPWSDLEKVK